MLVLGLKPGQSVIVDGDIEVKILALVNRGLVRVGIEAPQEVHIVRKELIEGTTQGEAPPRRRDGKAPGGQP